VDPDPTRQRRGEQGSLTDPEPEALRSTRRWGASWLGAPCPSLPFSKRERTMVKVTPLFDVQHQVNYLTERVVFPIYLSLFFRLS
jgi:hypothetical protein